MLSHPLICHCWVDGTQTLSVMSYYSKRYYGFDVQRAVSNAIFSDACQAELPGYNFYFVNSNLTKANLMSILDSSFQWGMELSERSSNGNWFWHSPCDSLSCPSRPEVVAPEAGLFSRNAATSDSEAIREKVPRHGDTDVLCGHTSNRRNDTQLLEPWCHRDYSLLAFYGQFFFRKNAKKTVLATFSQNLDWIFTENGMTIAKNNWS